MTDVESLFIDTNILVYASITESPLHTQALSAIQNAHQARRPLWISRQVLREYLVTLSRPKLFPGLSTKTIFEQARYLVAHFEVADDIPSVTEKLLNRVENTELQVSKCTMPTS